jgi:hypothetical protein
MAWMWSAVEIVGSRPQAVMVIPTITHPADTPSLLCICQPCPRCAARPCC